MTEKQRKQIQLLELYVAEQYNLIMVEGGDEIAEKLEGLFAARETALKNILSGKYDKQKK